MALSAGTRVCHCDHVVVVVLVAEVRVAVTAVHVMLQVRVQDLHRRTFCVVPTGQEEFKVFMENKVPTCTVRV